MAKTYKTTFLLKRGTTSQWAETDYVLKQGEPGFDYETGTLKIGNGTDLWADLPYVNDEYNIDPNGNVSYTRADMIDDFLAAEEGETPIKQNGRIVWTSGSEATQEAIEAAVASEIATEAARVNAITGTPDTGKTLQQEIDAVETDISTLKGNDANKSVRTIANEELAAQLIPANANESLDTLQEIAAWIQAHPNDVAAINAAITALQAKTTLGTYDNEGTPTEYANVKAYVEAETAALNDKVDKETGKGLSTNDYTTAEQSKLAGIAEGAEVNTITGVQLNGKDLSVSAKKINITTDSILAGIIFDCGGAPVPAQLGN